MDTEECMVCKGNFPQDEMTPVFVAEIPVSSEKGPKRKVVGARFWVCSVDAGPFSNREIFDVEYPPAYEVGILGGSVL